MKSFYTIFLFLVLSIQTSAKENIQVFDLLKSVNKKWTTVGVFTPEQLNSVSSISERELIQLHLNLVLKYLRQSQHNLTTEQLLNRTACLQKLDRYCKAGVFPINIHHAERQPYFIDDFGNYCAVGYLLKETGFDEVALRIHREMNYAYLPEVPVTWVEGWAKQFGFTLEELALIQPSYPPTVEAIDDYFYVGKNTPIECPILQNDILRIENCMNNLVNTLTIVDSTTQGVVSIHVLPNDTLVYYSPNANFVGMDSMRYSFSSKSTGCSYRIDTAKVYFNVLAKPGDFVSFLPGNSNYDAKRDFIDFLIQVKNIGEYGPVRDTAISDKGYTYCPPWSSSYHDFNAAPCDVDGNGIVNVLDIDSLRSFYSDVYSYDLYQYPIEYKIVYEPSDTIITAGDSIKLVFKIVDNITGNVVPLKALVLCTRETNSGVISGLNITPGTSKIQDGAFNNFSFLYEEASSTKFRHIEFMKLDSNIHQPQVILMDSFILTSAPVLEDSILKNGLIALSHMYTYCLDYKDDLISVNQKLQRFSVKKAVTEIDEIVAPTFRIYPNPSFDFFTFSLNDEAMSGELILSDLMGRIVLRTTIDKMNSVISTIGLPKGMYTATFTASDGRMMSEKVVSF